MTKVPRRNRFGSSIFGASAPSRGATGGSNDLLGDLVAKAQRGARGETGALELLERETEMRNLSKKAKTIIAGAAIAGLASAGGAYAYWTTTGTGTGSAATSAGAANLTVTDTSTISAMYPGDVAQTISGTVTNNAANSAYVTAVTVSIASVSGGLGSCDATDYTLVSPIMPVGVDVATTASTVFTGATIHFHNKLTNQDGCKGATVHLAYAAS